MCKITMQSPDHQFIYIKTIATFGIAMKAKRIRVVIQLIAAALRGVMANGLEDDWTIRRAVPAIIGRAKSKA